jgi:Icc-related predicted phosphoesterase
MPPPTPPRQLRIAALGDLHVDEGTRGTLAKRLAEVSGDADVIVLCGDLTDHGRPEQARALARELEGIDLPIVAVLGNHDYESDAAGEVGGILKSRGVHLLDGDHVVISGVGFAGVKGFGGGFGKSALTPFGEPALRQFVQEGLQEALKLETALRALETDTRVVLLHFAPITETLSGESPELYSVLGSSRLQAPIDAHGASVVFHAHAHFGSLEGRTPAEVPVYNVALPVLDRAGERCQLWYAPAPERRAEPSA